MFKFTVLKPLSTDSTVAFDGAEENEQKPHWLLLFPPAQ